MPRKRKTRLPANENTSSNPMATEHAVRAMRMRCAGGSCAVIARNAGTVAMGSMITNSELSASRLYSSSDTGGGWPRGRWSGKPSLAGSHGTRRKDRVTHAVDDLFVDGRDG